MNMVAAWSDLSYDHDVTIAIILVLVVIAIVGIDISVHAAKRPPRERNDGKIIVDLTKRK